MFDGSFTTSSVTVSFEQTNTLTLHILQYANISDYDISFDITPPIIERSEVDAMEGLHNAGDQPIVNDAYPPRIILTIRPSLRHHLNPLQCPLEMQGVRAKKKLILSTPTLLEQQHGERRPYRLPSTPQTSHPTPAKHHMKSQPTPLPDTDMQQVPLSSHCDPHDTPTSNTSARPLTPIRRQSQFQAQHSTTQHVIVKSAATAMPWTDSEMDHAVLDEQVDTKILMNCCGSQIPHEWCALGIQLGLKQSDINRIKPWAQLNVVQATQEMFSLWQQIDEKSTWRKLLRALRSEHINQKYLANNIQRELTK